MRIFLAQPDDSLRASFFPRYLMDRLADAGTLRVNDTGRVLSDEALSAGIGDADIAVIISWAGGQLVTEDVLAKCPNLKLIAIPCGSVATTITDSVYASGVKVCSSNSVMAQYVAEGTLAYMLAGLRDIPKRDAAVRSGEWIGKPIDSLYDARVGLVGLGTIGRYLLDLLAPFGVSVMVYDPYIPEDALARWPFAHSAPLEDVLGGSDVVSIHASRTPETYRLLSRERLATLRDGALLINTARGALIDEAALADELAAGRIRAVLDVFDNEPLEKGSPLIAQSNVILQPHSAGGARSEKYARVIVEEIERYTSGEPLRLEIPFEQYKRMTR